MVSYSHVICTVIVWSVGALRLQPDEHTDSPKLAICIVGAARMLVHVKVRAPLEEHLLSTKFARGLLKSTPDLFVSVHPGDSKRAKPDQVPLASHSAMSVSLTSIKHAMDTLAPVDYIIEEGAGPYPMDASVRKFISKESCYSKGNAYINNHDIIGRTMNYYHSFGSCHNLVVKHEEGTLLQYDNVMFSRPDILWLRDFPRKLLSSSTMIFEHDWFQVVPRKTSGYLGSLLEEHFLSNDPPLCDADIPEQFVNYTGKRAAREQGAKFAWTWDYDSYVKVMRSHGDLYNR